MLRRVASETPHTSRRAQFMRAECCGHTHGSVRSVNDTLTRSGSCWLYAAAGELDCAVESQVPVIVCHRKRFLAQNSEKKTHRNRFLLHGAQILNWLSKGPLRGGGRRDEEER